MNNSIETIFNKYLEVENNDEVVAISDIEKFVNSNLDNENTNQILDELFDELRDYYINNATMYEFKTQSNNELKEIILMYVKNSLVVYDSFEVIRNLDNEKSIIIIDEIFKNCVLRRNLDFYDTFSEKFETISKDELKKLCGVFSSVIYDCVSKLLSEESIKKSLEINTKIDPILVEYVTKMINMNFMELKINYIINKLYSSEE